MAVPVSCTARDMALSGARSGLVLGPVTPRARPWEFPKMCVLLLRFRELAFQCCGLKAEKKRLS